MPYLENTHETVTWISAALLPILGVSDFGQEVLKRALKLGLMYEYGDGYVGWNRKPLTHRLEFETIEAFLEHRQTLNEMWSLAFSGIDPIDEVRSYSNHSKDESKNAYHLFKVVGVSERGKV
jgi:hypothetical protein